MVTKHFKFRPIKIMPPKLKSKQYDWELEIVRGINPLMNLELLRSTGHYLAPLHKHSIQTHLGCMIVPLRKG